jgi:hypothetical protein
MEHGREGGTFGVWDVSNCWCEISNILLYYLFSSLLASAQLTAHTTTVVPTLFCLIATTPVDFCLQPCSTAQYCGPPQEQYNYLLNVPAAAGFLYPQAASLGVTVVQAWAQVFVQKVAGKSTLQTHDMRTFG